MLPAGAPLCLPPRSTLPVSSSVRLAPRHLTIPPAPPAGPISRRASVSVRASSASGPTEPYSSGRVPGSGSPDAPKPIIPDVGGSFIGPAATPIITSTGGPSGPGGIGSSGGSGGGGGCLLMTVPAAPSWLSPSHGHAQGRRCLSECVMPTERVCLLSVMLTAPLL
jgi:hypothetical protein